MDDVHLVCSTRVGVLDAGQVADVMAGLTCLHYFPADDKGRWAVFEEVGLMASDIGQVRWLARRMMQLFDRWPGPQTMRAVFCSRYRPKDGVEVLGSEAFPDGVPAERPALPGPEMKLLPPGSEDKGVDAAFQILASAVELKCQEMNAPTTPEEIAAAPEWLRKLEGYE